MPAQSKAQQRFMGMVHAAQKGELDNPSKEVEKVAKDMDKSDAKDFASTKHKGLPNHVKQKILKRVKEYAIIGDKHIKYPYNNEPLRSNDEMDIQEDRIPQNFNVGVASDYHTKVSTTPREDYDDTNFDKENSGQPDLKEGSADELEMLKLTVKAMKSIPGSPRQKEYIKQLNALRVKNGLKPLAETYIKEWGSALDNSYILNKDAKLDGTPEDIDAIDRTIESKIKESWTVKDGSVLSNGKLIGYYDFDRDSDSFWVDDVKKGKGQLSFDTKKEVEDYFKKNEKDAVKHLGKLRESINEEQPHQKEMIDGIVDMLNQVEDLDNRKQMALDRLNDFKKEGIEVDENEFLNRCGLDSINESPESLQKELEYQLKWAYTHFKQNPKDSRYEKVVKDTIDKIKQLKKTGRLEGINELPKTFNQIRVLSKEEFQNEAMNPREDALLKTFNDIVKNHSSLKVKDGGRTTLVDVQSANAVLKLYDALSDLNKKSLLKMPVGKMIKMAWHVLGKK